MHWVSKKPGESRLGEQVGPWKPGEQRIQLGVPWEVWLRAASGVAITGQHGYHAAGGWPWGHGALAHVTRVILMNILNALSSLHNSVRFRGSGRSTCLLGVQATFLQRTSPVCFLIELLQYTLGRTLTGKKQMTSNFSSWTLKIKILAQKNLTLLCGEIGQWKDLRSWQLQNEKALVTYLFKSGYALSDYFGFILFGSWITEHNNSRWLIIES